MLWVAITILALDRVAKYLAVQSPVFGEGMINDRFILFFTPHSVFSQWLSFTILCVVAIAILSYWKSLDGFRRREMVSPLILIIGGGASNVFDRFAYGGVIDMIIIPGISVFNIADIALVGGSAWIAYRVWRQRSILVRS